MQVERWVQITAKKNKFGSVELNDFKVYAKKPPGHLPGVTMRLEIDIPDELFVKPTISAKVHVPSNAKSLGEIIADVKGPLEDLMVETLGLKVELSVADPNPSE